MTIAIKDPKNQFGAYGCCGCGSRDTVSYKQCPLCAELDTDGNIIYRGGGGPLNPELYLPYYRSGEALTPQLGNPAPRRLMLQVEGFANREELFSERCENLNGTYYSTRSNPFLAAYQDSTDGFTETCDWWFPVCNKNRDFSPVERFTHYHAYLGFENQSTNPPSNASGRIPVYLYVDLSNNFGVGISGNVNSFNPPVMLSRRALVGHVDVNNPIAAGYARPAHNVPFVLDRIFFYYANSDVECTQWSNLEVDEIYLPDSGCCGQLFNDCSYPICDFSNVSFKVTSVKEDEIIQRHVNLIDAMASGMGDWSNWCFDIRNLGLPTFTSDNRMFCGDGPGLGPFQKSVSHLSEEYEDLTILEVFYPETIKATINGISNSGCNNCTTMNDEHYLFRTGNFVYTKNFDYYDNPPPTSLGSYEPPCCAEKFCGSVTGLCVRSFRASFLEVGNGSGEAIFDIYNGYSSGPRYARYKNIYRLKDIDGTNFSMTLNYDNTVVNAPQPTGSIIQPTGSTCDFVPASIVLEPVVDENYNKDCLSPFRTCVTFNRDQVGPDYLLVDIPDNWVQTSDCNLGLGSHGPGVLPIGTYMLQRGATTSGSTQVPDYVNSCSYEYNDGYLDIFYNGFRDVGNLIISRRLSNNRDERVHFSGAIPFSDTCERQRLAVGSRVYLDGSLNGAAGVDLYYTCHSNGPIYEPVPGTFGRCACYGWGGSGIRDCGATVGGVCVDDLGDGVNIPINVKAIYL